jgi:membrane carboxypeptidase/penicillin-binding protein
MTIAPQIIYRRQRRRMTARRNPLAKLALALLLVITLFFAIGGLLSAFAYVNLTRDLPSIEILPALLEPPDGKYLQPTKIYDRSGEHIILSLEHPAAVGRQYLYYAPEQESEAVLSDKLVTATLASADPFFWQHDGAPLLGIILGDRSTLAKRLAVDILLNEEPAGLRRTLRTAIIGKQITTQYGREKILEWYLNSANYGRLAYGADAAARVYFGKPAEELTLAEAAMLAAASETPELNPMDAPQAALERQKRVIQSMLQYRMIEPE